MVVNKNNDFDLSLKQSMTFWSNINTKLIKSIDAAQVIANDYSTSPQRLKQLE